MNRTVKILLWMAAAIAVLIGAAAIVLPAWIDPNQYRGMVESRLRDTLGREVTLGEIGLRVLPSISVSVADVSIAAAEPAGDGPFLEAAAVRGTLRILPLLQRRIEIGTIILEEPRIRLRRDADGSWNFDDILAGFTADDDGEPAAGETPAAVEVARVSIRDAVIGLEDRRVRPGETVRIELRDFDLEVRDFMPGARLRYEFGFSLPPHDGATLRSSGTIGLSAGTAGYPFEAQIDLRDLDPGPAGPYLTDFIDLEMPGGRFHLQVEAAGDSHGAVDLTGTIGLEDVVPAGSAAAPWDLDLSFDLGIDAGRERYEFRSLRLDSAGSKLAMQAVVDLSADRTRLELEIEPSRLVLDDLHHLLATLETDLPIDIASPDPLEITLRFSGYPDTVREADLEGSLSVSRLTLRHPSLAAPLEQVAGRIDLAPNRIAVRDFSAVIGSSDVAGDLTIENFDAPDVRVELRSQRARLGELLSFLPAAEPEETATAGTAAEEEWNSTLEKITAIGTLTIAEGSLDRLAFSDFAGTMDLRGRRIAFRPLQFRLYDGTYEGEAEVDLGVDPAAFRVTSRLAGVDSHRLLMENLDIGDLRGSLSGALEVRGTLGELEATLRGVTGNGTIQVADGRIEALDLLDLLTKVSGVFGERTLQQLSQQIAEQGTPFDSLSGHLQIGGGEIRSDDLALRSESIDLDGAGVLGMMDASIQLDVEVLLSKQVSGSMRAEKSLAAQAFWNASTARVEIPLRLAGPIDAPQPSVDFKKAGGNLLRSRLTEFLGGGAATPPPAAPAPAPSAGTPPAPDGAPAAAAADGLTIEISESRYSGNLLLPDVRVAGRFAGSDLSHASLRLTGSAGEEIYFEENAFPEVGAAAPGPDGLVQVVFSRKIEGKRLLGRGRVERVAIVLFDRQGGSVSREAGLRR